MRIRQVKPAFWTDAKVAALPPAVRLFYIGLWMEADDAGWFRWDLSQIANELYGYESRKKREREVSAYVDLLVKSERVVIHPCGHAEIPRLTDHQHLSVSTKQVKTFLREHAACNASPPTPAETREDPPLPASKGKGLGTGKGGGNGQVREGNGKGSAPANAPNGAGATTIDDPTVEPFLRVVNS
jgi:hypothetical protein